MYYGWPYREPMTEIRGQLARDDAVLCLKSSAHRHLQAV